MGLRGVIPLIVLSVGCRSLLGIDEAVVVGDADVDAVVADAFTPDAFAPVCPWPYSPLYIDPCSEIAPPFQPALALAGGAFMLDTNTGKLTASAAGTDPVLTTSVVDGARTIFVSRFEIASGATLDVTGSLPLLIVSSTTITIAGDLDVSSTFGIPGPGADSLDCGNLVQGAGTGTNCQHGASGGGGGGFGGAGGAGGQSSTGNACLGGPGSGAPGGAGGARTSELIVPRGGCPGKQGGYAFAAGDEGSGGSGGGAVNLVARNTLTIAGSVDAGGAGGQPSHGNRSGGGGGGSGGMIVAQAVMLAVTGVLAANGGAGGGGTSAAVLTTFAQRGQDGLVGGARAAGGTGEGTGGAGGPGGAGIGIGASDGQPGATSDRGSGGGGGGVGIIQIRGTLTVNGGTISPPPIP